MGVVLDHVTQFVNERDETADNYRAMGFNATPGGLHPKVGSANHLCYFDLFYIEMLSIHDMDEAMDGPSAVCRAAVRFIAAGEGLGGVAFETDDLDDVAEGMRNAGIDPGAVVDMQRVQSDGFVSLSRILYPTMAGSVVPLPIVIERNMGPAERQPLLVQRKVIAPHTAGALEIDSAALVTNDLEAAVAIFADGYGLHETGRFKDAALGGQCVRIAAGRGDLVLCLPDGPGRAQARLDARGAGLFAVTLRSEALADVRRQMGADSDGFVPSERLNGALVRII